MQTLEELRTAYAVSLASHLLELTSSLLTETRESKRYRTRLAIDATLQELYYIKNQLK